MAKKVQQEYYLSVESKSNDKLQNLFSKGLVNKDREIGSGYDFFSGKYDRGFAWKVKHYRNQAAANIKAAFPNAKRVVTVHQDFDAITITI